MARSQARIHTSVWRNRDFIKLTASAQATYWMVLSQPDVNMAGVVAYMPERWAQFRTDGDINTDLADLEHNGFLVVDTDSREVWIRSFVKNDGVLNSPKTRAAMWSAWSGVFSTRIRHRFLTQLDGVSVRVKDDEIPALDEAVRSGWITTGDIETARQNPPPDTPFSAPENPPSDTPSPRARAASASSSASSSTSGGRAHAKPPPPPPDDLTLPEPPNQKPKTPKTPTRWDHPWKTIETHVQRYGRGDPDKPDLNLDPRSEAALRSIGGLSAIRRDEANKFDFRDAWNELTDQEA